MDAQVAWAAVSKDGNLRVGPWRLYVTGDGGRKWRQLSVPAAVPES
jgi:hypothetical protein